MDDSHLSDRVVLLISPYFPPSTLAGVHRVRHLAKHLPATGWWPLVLCVDEARHEQRLDPALATLVPASVEVMKVGALPAWLTRPFGVGEISLRSWYSIKRALTFLLSTRPIAAVMITGAPFYPMLLAAEIKHRFGIPVVLDFQDPWVSTWGASRPAFSKAGITYRLATLLEPRALRQADFVTSVSDRQNEEMAARYPWLDASRMAAIPIGGDPEDFSLLRRISLVDGEDILEPGFIHFSYVGTFLPRAKPLMRVLFRAFARLRAAEPSLASHIRFNFVGTSNQPNASSMFRVLSVAEEEGVASAVMEIPHRVPYLTALNILAKSHGVLLIGSDEPHYTASKIYPALMCGRPYLSLFHRASSAHAILSASSGGYSFAFESQTELAELEESLIEGLRTLAIRPEALGVANRAVYAAYEAGMIARRFAEIFGRIVSSPGT